MEPESFPPELDDMTFRNPEDDFEDELAIEEELERELELHGELQPDAAEEAAAGFHVEAAGGETSEYLGADAMDAESSPAIGAGAAMDEAGPSDAMEEDELVHEEPDARPILRTFSVALEGGGTHFLRMLAPRKRAPLKPASGQLDVTVSTEER